MMGTVKTEECLERIAIALEGINQELANISGSLCEIDMSTDKLSELASAVNGYSQFCVTGNVTNII